MIDTHAHLNFPQLLVKIDKVIKQSQKAGLEAIIVVSSNISDSEKAISLAKEYPGFLWASVGIHPHKTDPKNKSPISQQLLELEKLIADAPKGKIVAVGECGLDFSEAPPGEESRNQSEQEKLFLGQIKLAIKYNLPLSVHVREASNEVLNLISEFARKNPGAAKKLRGVFHCYSGGKKRISKILNLPGKWYFGIAGNSTYSSGLQNVIIHIPQDRLLLETDAPFLAPAPYRGQTNTPAYLPLIARKMADIYQIPFEQIVKQTTQNAKELFLSPPAK